MLVMTNLTITVDDDVLKRARLWALQEHTSVNALRRDALEVYAGGTRLCRGALKIISAIEDPIVIAKFMAHLA